MNLRYATKEFLNLSDLISRILSVLSVSGRSEPSRALLDPASGGDENDTNIAPISLTGKTGFLQSRSGEGIFLEINAKSLKTWERNADVLERAISINQGWQNEYQDRYHTNVP